MQRGIRCSLLMLLVAAPLVALAGEEARIGRKIEDFTLRNHQGEPVSLSDFTDAKLVAVAFLGTECPLVKLYAARLEEMAQEFSKRNVVLIGINSNRQDPPTKIGAFARRYGMSFPILKDPDNRIADAFGAVRTPEIFLLDEQRIVRYWGRIDDQYGFSTGVGYGRPRQSTSEFRDAIDALLVGKEVPVPVTDAPGCIIGRISKVEPRGDVTYSNQIARIFQNRCVECHREGEIGPFPLTSYEEALGWGEMIREVVDEGRMPPWYADSVHNDFVNDPRLTAEEKQLIATWVENGQPEGDPADLPEPVEFIAGWTIPEPDQVFHMRDEQFEVQATGVVDYQHFEVDPGFTEDKWIRAVEARPDNRSVVHHIVVFIQPPGNGGGFANNGPLIGYAPGMPARIYPKEYGVRIPAGSKLVFQLHYTPVGTTQVDRSSCGFVWADPKEIKYEVKSGVCGKMSFKIPAGEPNHTMLADRKIRRDTTIMSFMPHMHLRGKSFRYEVEYPDGAREVLLNVPHYDFNWQLWYDYREPKILPKGSVLHCTAVYDNSEENISNPDPTVDVSYGDQTWEEMMFGWYTTVVPVKPKQKLASLPGD